jgi:hypothetical protein
MPQAFTAKLAGIPYCSEEMSGVEAECVGVRERKLA